MNISLQLQSVSQQIPQDPARQLEAPPVHCRIFHQMYATDISSNLSAASNCDLCVSHPICIPLSQSCWKAGVISHFIQSFFCHLMGVNGCWQKGLYACFVFWLSGELRGWITKNDILRQMTLVVLQLSHVMRNSHEKTSVVLKRRWSGFESCFYWLLY